MMNLAVMRQLVAEAESGAGEMRTARAALAHWGCDAGSLRAGRYSANAIYRVEQAGTPRFLRLSHAGDRGRAQIQAELDFIAYLAERGFAVNRPVPAASAARIVTVDAPYARFHAVLFTAAPGRTLELASDGASPTASDAQLTAWGRLMGEMHRAAMAYRPAPRRRRPLWDQVVDTVAAWLPPEERAAHRYLDEARAWLADLPRDPEAYGLIHWDFELDNLPWHAGRFHIIDFDDAAYFWYAADLAFAFDDVLDLPPARRDHVIDRVLAGYRSVRPAIEPWEATLSRFAALMRVFKVARVMHALAPADPALDPPWMAKLRTRFGRWFDEMRALFAQPFGGQGALGVPEG